MAKLSLAGLRDPSRRPRYIVWGAAALLGLAALVIVALGVTSTRWFCAEVCHKVQDDTIAAYEQSTHAEISCMACHMPVGSDPFTFVIHKVETLAELYLTVTNRFELPLNAESDVALEMESEQCTQCHGPNRTITPAAGIIIDHEAHEANDVSCAVCHNRIAHNEEGLELTLAENRPHEDFMKMEACYRCHGLGEDAQAPGECAACHPEGFELRPENHLVAGFYTKGGDSKGHAEAGKGDPAYCSMCHTPEEFCEVCHGLPMPHPVDFGEEHGEAGKSRPEVCSNCHGTAAGSLEFCNACHHKGSDPTKPWIPQHFLVVKARGAQACFECHNPTYCAECHVRGIR